MRKISFWLASLLHEKWGRRKPAQEVGEKIAVDNKIWNEEYGEPYCFKCKNKNLVEDIRGSEGVFSWTTTVYRCAKCGNIQKKI